MLENRVALVTGAASVKGIGFGIARKFAESGCHIVLNDILDPDEELVQEIEKLGASGIRFHMAKADVSDSGQVAEMVKEVTNIFGHLDILVNNAAFAPMPKSVLDIPEEEWDKTLDVNLKGAFLLTKAVGPLMKENKFGKIINISAASGLWPSLPDAHYNAAKAALIMLTQDTSLDLAPFNVTVNCICPGVIITALTETVVPEGMETEAFFSAMTKKNIPMQRPGYPEDIANAALFFASEMASYITGQTICVGGGAPLTRLVIPE
jgi:NAD(P)-dependent dehydrogenase (short-subunit alcohol dehydrogenase family)